VLSPSWTEHEVSKELRAQRELMRDHDRHLGAGPRLELEEIRRDAIRRSHSGTNIFDVEVWVSGELYRKDETWANIPNSSKRSYVHLGEPRFTNTLAYIVNESVGSVTLYTNMNWPVALDRLWEGYAIEPRLALPVLTLLGQLADAPAPPVPTPLRNFDGVQVTLDEAKAQQVLSGEHPDYRLRVDRTEVQGTPAVRYRFESKRRIAGMPDHVTYWLDAVDSRKLYRIESQEADQPPLVSTRSAFNESGWPRYWTTQSMDARGRIITKQVELLGGVDEDFDDWEIFAPVFPKDYLVSVSSGSGVAQLIQNPRGGRVVLESTGPERSLLSQIVPFMVSLTFIGLPIVIARRWTARRTQ